MTKIISRIRGFTLVEMAVVLVIFGLLLGGLWMPLAAQMNQRNYSETNQQISEIKEALIGYALTNGYLPCPAISAANGSENRAGDGTCNARVGFIPWVALGVKGTDSWNHLFRYSVTPAYARSDTSVVLSPPTNRDITIRTRNSVGNLVNLSNASDIPAVVISYGKNGFFGTSPDGTALADGSATNVDEDTNGAGVTTFISRDITDNTAVNGGEFDDIVAWISPRIYLSRLVSAGHLP